MAFSLLVFDCDGVILDSMDVKTEAMRRIGEPFGKELCDRLVMFQQIEGGISRFEKFNWLYQQAYGRPMTDTELSETSARYLRYLDDALSHCALIPGVPEVLQAWHGRVPMHVCSGAPHGELNAILKARGLAKYFTSIRGYPPSKTPLLAQIVGDTGANPPDVVMVGDTVTDSRAAGEVGTQFYGIGDMFAASPLPHGDNLHNLHTWLTAQAGA